MKRADDEMMSEGASGERTYRLALGKRAGLFVSLAIPPTPDAWDKNRADPSHRRASSAAYAARTLTEREARRGCEPARVALRAFPALPARAVENLPSRTLHSFSFR